MRAFPARASCRESGSVSCDRNAREDRAKDDMSNSNEKSLLRDRLGPILRRLASHTGTKTSGPEDWPKTLLRHVHRYEPSEGSGPFPTAILLHGCALEPHHLAHWGRLLADHGFLAFTIDSLTPRGIGPSAARLLVCTGLRLRGPERCRDITTILPFVLADPQVDRGRIHLVGWSHGAWTVTEWMLDASARAFAKTGFGSVASVVLLYPYCGIASRVHDGEWTSRAPLLVVTCGADRIVPNGGTRAFLERLSRAEVPVTHITLDGVGHAFDVAGNLAYDPQRAQELEEIVVSYLRRVSG
jgi:dienelactone hydrolase